MVDDLYSHGAFNLAPKKCVMYNFLFLLNILHVYAYIWYRTTIFFSLWKTRDVEHLLNDRVEAKWSN